MIKILGVEYISDKESSLRYGYSVDWFKKRRLEKKEPNYIKLQGKVLYHLHDTDEWFRKNIQLKDFK